MSAIKRKRTDEINEQGRHEEVLLEDIVKKKDKLKRKMVQIRKESQALEKKREELQCKQYVEQHGDKQGTVALFASIHVQRSMAFDADKFYRVEFPYMPGTVSTIRGEFMPDIKSFLRFPFCNIFIHGSQLYFCPRVVSFLGDNYATRGELRIAKDTKMSYHACEDLLLPRIKQCLDFVLLPYVYPVQLIDIIFEFAPSIWRLDAPSHFCDATATVYIPSFEQLHLIEEPSGLTKQQEEDDIHIE